jgi:hypothetical protein
MAAEAKPIDISSVPELLVLAEEVSASRTPRVLRRGAEDLAMLVPMRPGRTGRARTTKTQADLDAFLSSAGGWADVDTDAFLKANQESRDRSSRPAVEL